MSAPDIARSPQQAEAARVLHICNACRYCEGYCAVFPAVERRLDFSAGDLDYLANLCHDCRECYYSCQYAPPHEFALNLPATLAGLRRETWRRQAWPGAMQRVLGDSRRAALLAVVLLPLLFFLAVLAVQGPAALFAAHGDAQGAFYRLVPHRAMMWTFGLPAIFVATALGVAWRRFRRSLPATAGAGGALRAAGDSLRLRYLHGGGDGCAYPGEAPSPWRRRFHHLTFYGFLLCFAATAVATVYHYFLGRPAPYPVFSLPVILGIAGGLGLVTGPPGLLWLKARRDAAPSDPSQAGMDVAFLLLLFLTGLTGLALLGLRETAAMGAVLVLHLGLVMGLFLSLPYGKFVHALYRFGALMHFAKEERKS